MQGPLSEADINALLSSEIFGHLGCTDGTKPYVVPMAFVYRDNVIYGQTTEGKKVEMLRKNPSVCFQLEKKEDRQWQSVICWGTFEELEFTALQHSDAIATVESLTQRIGLLQDNVGIDVPFSFASGAAPLTINGKRSTLFRILITEKTGRFFSVL